MSGDLAPLTSYKEEVRREGKRGEVEKRERKRTEGICQCKRKIILSTYIPLRRVENKK